MYKLLIDIVAIYECISDRLFKITSIFDKTNLKKIWERPSRPKYIQIIKCSNEIYWYNKKIGRIYEVYEETSDYYRVKTKKTHMSLLKSDTVLASIYLNRTSCNI